MAQALAVRLADGGLVFVEDISLGESKTRALIEILKKLSCGPAATVVLEAPDFKLSQAGRNIQGFRIVLAGDLNAYTVLRSQRLIMTRSAAEKIGARWS
jgi:large subunit ribosomal protein L4